MKNEKLTSIPIKYDTFLELKIVRAKIEKKMGKTFKYWDDVIKYILETVKEKMGDG